MSTTTTRRDARIIREAQQQVRAFVASVTEGVPEGREKRMLTREARAQGRALMTLIRGHLEA